MKVRLYVPVIFAALLFHVAFIFFPYWTGYNQFKYAVLFITGIYLLFQYKLFLHRKNTVVNITAVYLVLVLISACINRDTIQTRDVLMAAIVYAVIVLELFFLFELFNIKGKTFKLVETFYYLALFYVLLTDLILVLMPGLYVENGQYYLIGNKFGVSYLHIELIAFYFQKIKLSGEIKRKNRIIGILYGILALFISIRVECSTGIVGIIIFTLMIIHSKYRNRIYKRPIVIVVVILAFSFILLLFSGILNNKYLSFFIGQVLHEDITLTGRMSIYANIADVFTNHLLWGYGYGSSFEIAQKILSAPNVQNGLLECVMQMGLLATICLIWLIYKIFSETKTENKNYPSVIMIFTYAALASVEITFDLSFIAWLVLVYVCRNTKSKESGGEKRAEVVLERNGS